MTSLAFDTNITDSVSTAVGMLNRDNGTAFDWPSAVHGPVYIFSKRLDKWFLCGCTNNVYNPGHCEMSLSAPSGSIPILKLKSASLSAPDESQNIAVTWANKSLSFPGFEFYGPWKIARLVYWFESDRSTVYIFLYYHSRAPVQIGSSIISIEHIHCRGY